MSRPVNRAERVIDARIRLMDLVIPYRHRPRGAAVDFVHGHAVREIRDAIDSLEDAAVWFGNGEPAGSIRPARRLTGGRR